MDPLTIIGSVCALAQASDRIIQLSSKLWRYRNVPRETQSFCTEILRFRVILDAVSDSAAAQLPGRHHTVLVDIIHRCRRILNTAEVTLLSCAGGGESSEDNASIANPRTRSRIKWLLKKRSIEELKQELRDAIATLTLILTLPIPWVFWTPCSPVAD
jgi:hypothetical protein